MVKQRVRFELGVAPGMRGQFTVQGSEHGARRPIDPGHHSRLRGGISLRLAGSSLNVSQLRRSFPACALVHSTVRVGLVIRPLTRVPFINYVDVDVISPRRPQAVTTGSAGRCTVTTPSIWPEPPKR